MLCINRRIYIGLWEVTKAPDSAYGMLPFWKTIIKTVHACVCMCVCMCVRLCVCPAYRSPYEWN